MNRDMANITHLRKNQEASALVYMATGDDIGVSRGDQYIVKWSAALWNYGGMFPDSGEGSKFTIQVSGVYEVWCIALFDDDNGLASGDRQISLQVNGSMASTPRARWEPPTSPITVGSLYAVLELSAGDEVEFVVQQTSSAGDVELFAGVDSTRACITLLGTLDSTAAWTAPSTTWAAGDTPTAANFNAQIRDNLLNLRNCKAALAVVRLNANESILNITTTYVPWDEAVINHGTLWAIANPTRLTAPVTGWYVCWFNVRWKQDADGDRLITVRKNGTTTYEVCANRSLSDGDRGPHQSGYIELALSATDYVELGVYHSAGGALGVRSAQTRFGLHCVGD